MYNFAYTVACNASLSVSRQSGQLKTQLKNQRWPRESDMVQKHDITQKR